MGTNDLSQITGEPIKFTIKSKEYEFSLMTIQDAAKLSKHMKDSAVETYLLGKAKEGKSAEYIICPVCKGNGFILPKRQGAGIAKHPVCIGCSGKGYIHNEILMNLLRDSISYEVVYNAIYSIEGALFLLWLSLTKKYPDMTIEDVGNLFGLKEQNLVFTIVNTISAIPDVEKDKTITTGKNEKNLKRVKVEKK